MAINLYGREAVAPQSESDPNIEVDAERLDIPIHAFDLIIADECHRGYTAKETAVWRNVLDYFDAIKIGLTATPAPHSLSLFNEVIYRFTTEEAIESGCLVDYDAVRIKSNVRLKGAFLKEGEHVGLIDTETGREMYDQLEDEREFSSEQIERDITAPESNGKIIREIAQYAYRHQEEKGHFPKTLIFAVNDLPFTSPADQLVKICREEFGQGDAFVQKITGSPSVDIPRLEFIVFLRPVKSRILWVQMLGRGTRLCPEIHKSKFTIFDCFDGTLIEYFRNTTDFPIEPPQKDPVTLSQVIENIYQNINRDYYTKVLIKRLRRIDRDMSGEARKQFADYIPDGNLGQFAGELTKKIKSDFIRTMDLLRNPDFQDLLQNYQRAKKPFWIGYEIGDEVTSEVMIQVGPDYQKPADYLESFRWTGPSKRFEWGSRSTKSKANGWASSGTIWSRT